MLFLVLVLKCNHVSVRPQASFMAGNVVAKLDQGEKGKAASFLPEAGAAAWSTLEGSWEM